MPYDINHRRVGTSNPRVLPELPPPEVSVVLTAHNNAPNLPYVLNSWCSPQGADFEVLICDDGSTDDALAVCRQDWPFEVRYLWKPHRGFHYSHMMNAGMRLARAPVVLISDTGCLAYPDLLRLHLETVDTGMLSGGLTIPIMEDAIFRSEPADLASVSTLNTLLESQYTVPTSPIRNGRVASWDDVVAALGPEPAAPPDLNSFSLLMHLGVTTNICMMRDDALALGGFDERYVHYGLQDFEFFYRWLRAGHQATHSDNPVNLNIGRGEQKLSAAPNAALFRELTGVQIWEETIERGEIIEKAEVA